jgi:uncharacterized membrane-anchored protein YhcB (DUF1043 family)
MNEQLLSVIIAAVVGFLTNIVVKRMEKEKTKEEKEQIAIETAGKSLEIMKETLQTIQERNKSLEEKMAECVSLKEELNHVYSVVFSILDDETISIPDEKRQELIDCLDRRKKNAKTTG